VFGASVFDVYCHGYDSLKLYNDFFLFEAFRRKEAISESQIAFVSLSLNNTGNLSTNIFTGNDEISEFKARRRIIYLLLFTLDRENCLMNVCCLQPTTMSSFGEGFRARFLSICLLFFRMLVIYSCSHMEYVVLWDMVER
jgi:hypothetical protein